MIDEDRKAQTLKKARLKFASTEGSADVGLRESLMQGSSPMTTLHAPDVADTDQWQVDERSAGTGLGLSSKTRIKDWERAVHTYIGRGKTTKTSTARFHVERFLEAGRPVRLLDLDPINKGIASFFPEDIVERPDYSIETGGDFAEVFFQFVKDCAERGCTGIVDTPGNDSSVIGCADTTDLVAGVNAYGVKLGIILCCGAETNDMALIGRLSTVMRQPPDALVLCVSMNGLPAHLKSPRSLRKYFVTQDSLQRLMRGRSHVVYIPACRTMVKLDDLQTSIHEAARTPLVHGLEPFEAGQIATHLHLLAKAFDGIMP